ncbi:MAG: hypothetical protein ACR5KV_01620 [Wolbachia sp.]
MRKCNYFIGTYFGIVAELAALGLISPATIDAVTIIAAIIAVKFVNDPLS